MGPSRLSWLAYGLASALLSQVGSATQLEPIDILGNAPGHVVARDNDYTKMDLLSAETFLWGGLSGKGKYALGNFTAYMPGKHENIIAMEKFYPWLKSTECTKDSLTMYFEDEEAYRYGAKTWKWVNDAKDHTFVLVAGRGHCQWNEDRLPFTITDVEFDDCANTIKAIGKATDWPSAAHSYELFVGGRPASKKRDYEDSYAFDISQDLPLNKAAFTFDGVQLEYTCDGCGTRGEFEFAFYIKTEFKIPVDVELTVSPNAVEAIFEPQLKLSVDIGGKIERAFPIGTIPIAGVSIAGGILDLGPHIEFELASELGPLKGSASVSGGGTASLEDSAQLTLDLLDPNIAASGWSPQFTPKPLTMDAALGGSLKIGLKASVALTLSALDKGFEVGIELFSYLGCDASVKASTEDACPEAQGSNYALLLEPVVGIDLVAEASPITEAELGVTSWKLEPWCTGLDEGPSAPSTSYTSSLPSIPSFSSPAPHHLTSAPPSSFPAPLTPIPEPSSWWYPSGSYPGSAPSGSPTGAPRPSGSSTFRPPPPSSVPSSPPHPSAPSSPPPSSVPSSPLPSSGPPSPLPTSSGITPIPLPQPTSISVPLPPPPPPPPASSSSSAIASVVYKRHAGRIHA